MEILKKTTNFLEGFSWVNYDYLPDSTAFSCEIYLSKEDVCIESLIKLFHNLFHKDLIIGQPSPEGEWGQFCLENWNFDKDQPDYDFVGKSLETRNYLNLLLESKIEFDYVGLCKCENWNVFLRVILECILTHKAPYSPLFYDLENNYMFYFHHTCSIGIYYKEYNQAIRNMQDYIKNGH